MNQQKINQELLNAQLHQAVLEWEESKAITLLSQGAQFTPSLFITAMSRQLTRVIEKMLPTADLTYTNEPYYECVLNSAAEYGHINVLKAALKVMDPTIVKHPGGVSALMFAASSSNLECLKLLLSYGGEELQDCYGCSFLVFAAKSVNTEILEYLLTSRSHTDRQLFEALLVSAERGGINTVKLLLSHGADLNFKDTMRGDTALSLAMECDEWECVDYLGSLSHQKDAELALEKAKKQGIPLPLTAQHVAKLNANEEADLIASVTKTTEPSKSSKPVKRASRVI